MWAETAGLMFSLSQFQVCLRQRQLSGVFMAVCTPLRCTVGVALLTAAAIALTPTALEAVNLPTIAVPPVHVIPGQAAGP